MRRRKLEFRRSGETPENRSLGSIAAISLAKNSFYPLQAQSGSRFGTHSKVFDSDLSTGGR